jgi:hypothetical protein
MLQPPRFEGYAIVSDRDINDAMADLFRVAGAGRGNRTPTVLLGPADFKSAASANFAIPAMPINY